MRDAIGLRRESIDANERRAPLTPDQVRRLIETYGIEVLVQPSSLRIFPDEDYADAGAEISEDLSRCNVVFGVNAIPIEHIEPRQVYCFFSHTVKAQRYNMPMLRQIIDSGATLLDYALVTNEIGVRLISLGDLAGCAGMIDSLSMLGRRLDWEGIPNPFAILRQAHEYDDLAEALASVAEVGSQIRREGLPDQITPFVCAFTGTGQVSEGAQTIYNMLPSVALRPEDLPTLRSSGAYSRKAVYSAVFRKPDLYEPLDPESPFDAEKLEQKPGSYRGRFHRYAEFLIMVVNGISWSPRFPRLLTREHLRELYERRPSSAATAVPAQPALRLIGDMTCDVEGSIEFTVRRSSSKDPAYVFEPVTNRVINGYAGNGPVILSVDRIAAELPREASESLGDALMPFIPSLARADFTRPFERLDLPASWLRAVIAHRGRLTAHFHYLNQYLL